MNNNITALDYTRFSETEFEPYLQVYPSPESTFYSALSDNQVFQPEDGYAILSEFDNVGAYTSPSYINNYIPEDYHHMMLLQKSYSEPNLMFSSPSFLSLSREQLIKGVAQLEMEQSSPSIPCTSNYIYNEQDYIHSCLWVNCKARASTLEKLMIHICEQHIGSGKAIYFCEWKDCARNKKPFMKRHKMHNHMRTHTGERPFVCTVIGCNKTFSRPDSLSTHIKTHSDIRPYLCSFSGCEKAYFHSRSLRKHVKSCHLKT